MPINSPAKKPSRAYLRALHTPVRVELGPLSNSARVSICYSELAWRKAAPAGSLNKYDKYCETPAEIWRFSTDKLVLVCFDMEKLEPLSLDRAAGLMAHEATHVAQQIAKFIAEEGPLSEEVQAYVVQWVTSACWFHLPRDRIRKK